VSRFRVMWERPLSPSAAPRRCSPAPRCVNARPDPSVRMRAVPKSTIVQKPGDIVRLLKAMSVLVKS